MIAQLEALHAQKAALTEGQRKVKARNATIAETFKNQDRLRENIRSLEKVGQNALTTRYLKDLDKEEDGLIAMRREIAGLEEKDAALRAAMAAAQLKLAAEVKRLRDEAAAEATEPEAAE